MKLDEAIKVYEVTKAIDKGDPTAHHRNAYYAPNKDYLETLIANAKARRQGKNGMLYAWSKTHIKIDTYHGPSQRVVERLVLVQRRSNLYFQEVYKKEDWEPL